MALAFGDAANRPAMAQKEKHRPRAAVAPIRCNPFPQHLPARSGDSVDPARTRPGRKDIHDPRALADLPNACTVEVHPGAMRTARVSALHDSSEASAPDMAVYGITG